MKASRALAAAIASHRPDRRKSPGLSPRASLAVTPTPPERVVEQASVATRAAVIAAARIIQLHWRRTYYRRAWRGIEAKWWQHAVSRKKQTPTFAATVIQRWWRLQIVICRQLAACRIQSVLRTFVTPQMQILVRAAKLIQSSFRRYANHRRFLFLSSQALRIQTYYRGFLARRSLTKELDQMRQAKSRWLFNMSRGMFQPLWTYRVGGAGLRGSALDPLDILNQGEGHLSEARSLRKAASQKDIASSIKRTPVIESRILQKVRLGFHARRTCQRKTRIGGHSPELAHSAPTSPVGATDLNLSHALFRYAPGVQVWTSANASPMQSPVTSPNSSPRKPILSPEDVDCLLKELLGRGFLSCAGHQADSNVYCTFPCSDLDAVRARLLHALPPYHEIGGIFRVECGDTAVAAYSAVRDALGPEHLLWHGTSWESVANVTHHGFNRAYAYGGRHGAKLGKGCYFATDPAYAMRFCGRSAISRPVFLAGVLPGKFTRGKEGIIEAPLADEAGARFDSTVDDLSNPKVFCVFRDFQALPLYLAEVIRAC